MDSAKYKTKIGYIFTKHENPGIEADTEDVSTQWEVTQLQLTYKNDLKLYREQRSVEQALRN